ncbi:MAG: ATP-binding protein [Planctomycetota bacterium]
MKLVPEKTEKSSWSDVPIVADSDSSRGSTAYMQSMYGFFVRARAQNVVGHMGASIFVFAMTLPYLSVASGLLYLVVHQLLMLLVAFTFYSKWTNQRLNRYGLPAFALTANLLAKSFLTSIVFMNHEPGQSYLFCLIVMMVAYACAAGTMVTLGPLKRLARQDLICMLTPGLIGCFYWGHNYVGLGTIFFIVVVAVAGLNEMYGTYCELIKLRAGSQANAETLNKSNKRLKSAIHSLQVEADFRIQAEKEREALQQSLVEASHEAGKAEIATGVLHNVGNVMNTVTVSSGMMQESLRTRVCERLDAAIAILETNEEDLAGFFNSSEQGSHFIPFMKQLGDQAREVLDEINTLRDNVDHVNSVVAAQQSYATTCGFHSVVSLRDVIETSLQIVAVQLQRNEVTVIRNCDRDCMAMTDRQKLIQVLVNLFRNADHSIAEFGSDIRELTIRLTRKDESSYLISVTDTGHGITEEVMEKIFQHGFTTRQAHGGHGFGLHHSVIAMEEMEGSLTVESDGHGRGATFHLVVPAHMGGVT